MRLCGPLLLGPAMCHLVALCTGVLRCPRTYSGRRPATRTVGVTVGFHGRPRTESPRPRTSHGRAACGLASVAERSVQLSAHRCHGLGAWLGTPVRNVTYRRRSVAAGCGHGDDRRAGICAWLCSGCCVPFVYLGECLTDGGKLIRHRSPTLGGRELRLRCGWRQADHPVLESPALDEHCGRSLEGRDCITCPAPWGRAACRLASPRRARRSTIMPRDSMSLERAVKHAV